MSPPREAVPEDQNLPGLEGEATGYRGSYSFEVFTDDCPQMPLQTVASRALRPTLEADA